MEEMHRYGARHLGQQETRHGNLEGRRREGRSYTGSAGCSCQFVSGNSCAYLLLLLLRTSPGLRTGKSRPRPHQTHLPSLSYWRPGPAWCLAPNPWLELDLSIPERICSSVPAARSSASSTGHKLD